MQCCFLEPESRKWSPPAPSLMLLFLLLLAQLIFRPEAVPGAADEHVFKRRTAHRNGLNLAGKGLHHIWDEPVSLLTLQAHFIVEYITRHTEAGLDFRGQCRWVI